MQSGWDDRPTTTERPRQYCPRPAWGAAAAAVATAGPSGQGPTLSPPGPRPAAGTGAAAARAPPPRRPCCCCAAAQGSGPAQATAPRLHPPQAQRPCWALLLLLLWPPGGRQEQGSAQRGRWRRRERPLGSSCKGWGRQAGGPGAACRRRSSQLQWGQGKGAGPRGTGRSAWAGRGRSRWFGAGLGWAFYVWICCAVLCWSPGG